MPDFPQCADGLGNVGRGQLTVGRAIGEENNRNRRDATPAQIARKLMVLDYVLTRRDINWSATEKEKVELLPGLVVPLADLPGRLFATMISSSASR